jgi:crossover junction endodeoxyribonuclease RuvC
VIILGIDPGTATTGCAVIEATAGGSRLRALDYGCIRTSADLPMHMRLQQIYNELCLKAHEFRPDVLAIEQLYFNKNVRTALAVGQARGVAILAAANCGLRIAEYTPLQVKQAVTGYGRASKTQVQRMVAALLHLQEIPRPDDAADALAIAICHGHSCGLDAKLSSAGGMGS